MKKSAFTIITIMALAVSCNEYKKKEILGSWTPVYSTIETTTSDIDTMEFDHVLKINKKKNTYEWTGWLNPGEWTLNKDNSQISFKAEDGSGEMFCRILANDGSTLELKSIPQVEEAGTYHMLFTK